MDNEPTALAAAADRALRVIGSSTGSPPCFETSRPVEVPTTIEEARQLREWALAPAPPTPAATPDQLARHLEFMHAALPSRANDVDTGKKRFAVYAGLLAGRSNDALAFMARTACATLDWFPTVHQCLDILATYRPPVSERATALLTCDHFMHAAFEVWLRNLRDGQPVGDVPERWKRIAYEQDVMRRLENGQLVSRALYHGPPRPPYRPAARAPSSARPAAPTTIAGEPGASEGHIA